MTSLNIPSGKESQDLPYLYWIPKLHKTPYKERYIAGSIDNSFVEQVDDPAMYLSLYGVLWSLGIQYK
jgi:hypothetical protein